MNTLKQLLSERSVVCSNAHRKMIVFLVALSCMMPVMSAPVTAPEDLEATEWSMTYTDRFGVEGSLPLKIGFDGSDVYLQGLCTHLPKAWLKGKLEGGNITFPGWQYFGLYEENPYSGYDMYLQEENVVFSYEAETDRMIARTGVITICTATGKKSDIYDNVLITKVVDRAATPAMPVIKQIWPAETGPVVLFAITTLDVDDYPIAASKLSFQFLCDNGSEIVPVTFEPADYPSLTETMTVFPYGFDDNTDFCPAYFRLKQADYGQWSRIGLQSIYTGGGVEHKSEIAWISITTGISDAPCLNKEIIDNTYYDLNGRRLSEKPTTPGIYIVNGRKVMIK